jgi:hypothetical protein
MKVIKLRLVVLLGSLGRGLTTWCSPWETIWWKTNKYNVVGDNMLSPQQPLTTRSELLFLVWFHNCVFSYLGNYFCCLLQNKTFKIISEPNRILWEFPVKTVFFVCLPLYHSTCACNLNWKWKHLLLIVYQSKL